MPERGSNPRSPPFQAGRFNHCIRAPAQCHQQARSGQQIVPLDMKGCICHFVKWQIHPFISKGTKCTRLRQVKYLQNRHHYRGIIGTALRHRPAKMSRQLVLADPMLGQCWAGVVDSGPALILHWVTVSH